MLAAVHSALSVFHVYALVFPEIVGTKGAGHRAL
jgi:hypothetical protein